MDQELKVMLQTILESQQSLINNQEKFQQELESIKRNQESFQHDLELVHQNQVTFHDAVHARFDKLDNEIYGIQKQLERIESDSNQDIIAMLEVINGRLEHTATKEDIDFLAGKLGQHDLEIDRLKRIK